MRSGLILLALGCAVLNLGHADDLAPAASSDDSKPSISQTWADKLKKDLLLNYDRNVRPTQHYNVTNVDVQMTIFYVDIDEHKSIFSVHGWLSMAWNDDKLKWNSTEYGGIEEIRFPPDSVWKPDLVLYNSARGSDIEHYGKTNVVVYSNGKMLWVPPTDLHSFCELDMRLWPFDEQTCHLKIGSWTFDGNKLNLTANNESELDFSYVTNHEWKARSFKTERITTTYKGYPDRYLDVRFYMTLQRRSSTHKAIVVSPAFVIILMVLSVFWLPTHCGEKIVLNAVIALIVTEFLIYFAQQLPAMARNTPLIVSFFSTTFYLVGFSTILSVIVLRLTRTRHSRPVPRVLKNQLDGRLGSFFGANGSGSFPSAEEKEGVEGEIGDVNQRDWLRLAGLIDRLAFVAYLVVFFISAIYYSL